MQRTDHVKLLGIKLIQPLVVDQDRFQAFQKQPRFLLGRRDDRAEPASPSKNQPKHRPKQQSRFATAPGESQCFKPADDSDPLDLCDQSKVVFAPRQTERGRKTILQEESQRLIALPTQLRKLASGFRRRWSDLAYRRVDAVLRFVFLLAPFVVQSCLSYQSAFSTVPVGVKGPEPRKGPVGGGQESVRSLVTRPADCGAAALSPSPSQRITRTLRPVRLTGIKAAANDLLPSWRSRSASISFARMRSQTRQSSIAWVKVGSRIWSG